MHTKKISRILSLFLTMALVFSLMPTALATDNDTIKVSPQRISLGLKESDTIKATVTSSDGKEAEIIWESSDDDIVSIGSNTGDTCTVTAKAVGTATITATVKDTDVADSCTVTVDPDPSIKINNEGTISLEFNKTIKLSTSVTPESAKNDLKWESSDNTIATVSSDGTVTAREKEGPVTITARFSNGTASDSCIVEVKRPAPSLDKTNISLKVGDKSSITLRNLPDGATVSWSVTNTNGAMIVTSNNNGCTVEGLSAGVTSTVTATITPRSGSNISLRCTVNVSSASTPSISRSRLSIVKNRTDTLTINNMPTGGSVAWSSSKTWVSVTGSGTGNRTGTVKGTSTGTAEISAVVKDSNNNVVGSTLKCTVTITSSSSSPDDIEYTGTKGKPVKFRVSDFKDVCLDYKDESLKYVKFTLPSASKGTLYYDYDDGDYSHKVSSSRSYYPNSSYYLSDVSFVPDTTGTISIEYTAYYGSSSEFDGKIKIRVSGSSGDVVYDTDENENVKFTDSAFNSYCKEETGNSTYEYIKFDEVSKTGGTIYYKYGTSNEEKASTKTKYYRSKSPYLTDLTFVPKKNHTDTVYFDFDGNSSNDKSFSGQVEINIGKKSSSKTITYTVDKNGKAKLSKSDFSDFSKKKTDYDFEYIKFDSVSPTGGTLYLNYGSSDEKKASTNTKYYRNDDPYLSDLTFVAKDGYKDTVKINFTGYNTKDKSFTGTLEFKMNSSATTVKGDIIYKTSANSKVPLSVNDFNEYCLKETKYNLDYVTFKSTGSTSEGSLYYKYGETGQKPVTSSANYFKSKELYLKDVTFVPKKDFAGPVEIEFTVYNTMGTKATGTLGILFESLKDPNSIIYTTGAKAVTFVNSDFVSACAKRGGDALKSVKFTLPDAEKGTLYYNYVSPTSFGGKVTSTTAYTNGTGTGSIGAISFLPKAGYNGIVVIAYTGTDNGGNTYSGTVSITVAPPAKSTKFKDMNNHAWATPSVEFLNDYKIVNGTSDSAYNPAGSISRGDFILMLYRAFNFTSTSTSNFKDVPTDSYYYEAIAAAKALGIAQGSNNRFDPQGSLTREDAMVLIQRAMEKTNHPLAAGSTSTLDRFGDKAKISSYAKSAVATLAQASVVKGDDKGNFNPKNSISRAEMAVALHRVLTL